ncbi:FliM/FliN family flagellar motor switch protein [Pseudoalteromonas prydzensis]|nr:FliM/FliN family flagellar motor switch protein [Pseudoalteromonas prydzensis]MBE0378077.1 flagellar motor switch protein FliN/FliY [Pseudoalteromonas prydzensis ACAM 620]
MSDNLDDALAGLELDGLDDLTTSPSEDNDMSMFADVPLTITLEVASTELTLGELSQATHGDVLRLDKAAGEPMDVKVNGVYFAKAEVVMVDGQYGIKFIAHDKQIEADK